MNNDINYKDSRIVLEFFIYRKEGADEKNDNLDSLTLNFSDNIDTRFCLDLDNINALDKKSEGE